MARSAKRGSLLAPWIGGRLTALLLGAFLSACTSISQDLRRYGETVPAADQARLACLAFLSETQTRIDAAEVRDAEARHVAGFPYLRVSRFLAAIKPESARLSEQYRTWAEHLLRLESEALEIELGNLPASARHEVAVLAEESWGAGTQPLDAAKDCGERLLQADLQQESRRGDLLEASNVPDHYSDLSRILGLYPLMTIPVNVGWNRWQEVHLPAFDRSPSSLPIQGWLLDFAPDLPAPDLTADGVAALLEASLDATGTPRPEGQALTRLFDAFAPVWRVDVTGPFDKVGHPAWREDGTASVDTGRPTVFTRLSHTRLNGETLPQLSYAAWFAERPAEGTFDLLAGKLDALIWRVTLGRDGRPVIYDTIHACGCYHFFFPPPDTALLEDAPASSFQEPNIVPARAPALGPGQRMVLHIESRSHYLKGLSVQNPADAKSVTYAMAEDRELQSLPLPSGGTRSLYESNGIVAGSERLERFLLWPMGIENPGAMRQWGTHATAFVGTRHFDDPDLFDTLIAP